MVEHSVNMKDGPVPVFPWKLLLFEVGTGHVYESTPGSFNYTFGALYFSRD